MMENRLEKELTEYLNHHTLLETMDKYSGRYVYVTNRPFDKLSGFGVTKTTLQSIEFAQWRGGEIKLRIGTQNLKEGSASSNNTEFNQFFWTFDEAIEQMREWFDKEFPSES